MAAAVDNRIYKNHIVHHFCCDSFLENVHHFCEQHYIDIIKMDDMFTRWASCDHRVDLFYGVIDMQVQELNDLLMLDDQLETYICDMRSNKAFGDLSEKLVMSKKSMMYLLVYMFLTLTLILPVATAK